RVVDQTVTVLRRKDVLSGIADQPIAPELRKRRMLRVPEDGRRARKQHEGTHRRVFDGRAAFRQHISVGPDADREFAGADARALIGVARQELEILLLYQLGQKLRYRLVA